MLKVIVTCRVRPGSAEAFLALARRLAAAARGEPGCAAYQVCQDVGDGNLVLLVEEWETREALGLHLGTATFRELTDQMVPMHAGEPEYRTCTVTG
jgi:quinol monooxygenase YgiN